jgi:ketosteroid isomerase-like protein
MADQAEDEAAIKKVMDQINAAYNKHDAKELSSYLVDNYENWTGSQKGLAEFQKSLSEGWERQKDQFKRLEEHGILFVSQDVGIYKVSCESTGELDADGKPLPPRKWLGAWVFSKQNGKWLCSAFFSRPIEE